VFDDWIPGVLSREQILELKARNRLQRLSENPKAIDSSAVDLHLSDEGYELPEGSVKPSGQRSYVAALLHGSIRSYVARPIADTQPSGPRSSS
jgi:hypothetical protein